MKLKALYCDAVRAWDKKIRLVGKTAPETLYDESLEALQQLSDLAPCLVDVGAGNGILGFPWLESSKEHKCLFLEPDIKKAAFMQAFIASAPKELALKTRALVIPKKLEDVPRETIEAFSGGVFCLATRAFSGPKTLKEAFDLSQLKNDKIFVFDLVNGRACFKNLV